MDPVYRVCFFKKLTDSTGHPVEACQGMVEVHAIDVDDAVELGRKKFAEFAHVRDWLMRADYETVEILRGRTRLTQLRPPHWSDRRAHLR
jgi:hypothetical protein